MVRNAVFRRVELAARQRWDELAELSPGPDWAADLGPYFDEYDTIGTGPDARGPQLFRVETRPGFWQVRQTLDDPAGDHGWALLATVDLAESDAAGDVVFDEVTVVSG
jgi:hypothetical protein